jgi:hypothetical protein
MHHNKPIKLTVANREQFVLPAFVLNLMLVVAALLSPYPVLMTIGAMLIGGAGWVKHTLEKSKTNRLQLTSVIFADGQVRLESGQEDKTAGFLNGQQWCTRWLAVLRVTKSDTTRHVVILSSQQRRADDFRRLNMWLRQGLFSSTGA